MPMARYVKLLKLPNEVSIKGIRPMAKKDVKIVQELIAEYLKKFEVFLHFTNEEIEHFLLPRENVIESYVIENPETGKITDFISFYNLPSSILKHETHKLLKVAYSYYNVANTVAWDVLMRNALILAKQKDFDVFNALDIMENDKFLN
jgi:glycylpeptide N-tetradecanoyltransferase